MYYELFPRANKSFFLIPHDLSYFNDHFICKEMKENWKIPPIRIQGNKYKIRDFVPWMLVAPIVSQKAMDAILNISGNDVEFLPFHDLKNKKYYAMNVLSTSNYSNIFKTDARSVVYVSDKFGEMAKYYGLTGLYLADPSANNGWKIVHGQDINVFPGLLN